MDRSSFEENRKVIASNLAIAESNKAIADSNETLSISTTQASINISNAIAMLDIASLVAVNQQILETLKDLVKVLTPAPIKGPVEPIKEIDG
jgi:hypothetical protein